MNELEKELIEKNLISDNLKRNIFRECEIIGFDIDHTLALYNLTNLSELMYKAFLKYLIDIKEYPKCLDIFCAEQELKNVGNSKFSFLTKDNFYKMAGVEILIDSKNGNCLKLSHHGFVLKAFHGMRELKESEIKAIYGEDMKIPEKYNYSYEKNHNEHYFYIQGYFENHISSLYSFLVELIDLGLFITEQEILFNDVSYINYNPDNIIKAYERSVIDIIETINFTWTVPAENKIQETGYLFPEIFSNPCKYLCKNSAKYVLILLKRLGKRIFYASNSHREFAHLIIKHALGEDYIEFFDIGVSLCRKPKFFDDGHDISEIYFCFVNHQSQKQKDKIFLSELINDDSKFEMLKKHKAIESNSFEVVKLFYEKLLNKNSLKYIFIGDSILNDCVAPVRYAKIQAIAILEFINCFYHGIKHDNLGEKWTLSQDKEVEQVHIKVTREHAEFAISNVQSLRFFI